MTLEDEVNELTKKCDNLEEFIKQLIIFLRNTHLKHREELEALYKRFEDEIRFIEMSDY